MRVLDRKLRRDLAQTKGMLAAIIAIIAVGVGCLVGFYGTFYNLENARTSYYSRCRMADFWMELKKAPVLDAAPLADIPGVSEIRTRIKFPVIVDLPGVDKPVSGEVLSLPEDKEKVINGIVLLRGTYFTRERRDEVIVSERFSKVRNINPGDFIHLVMNGRKKKLFVVGSAVSSEYMYMTPPGSIVPEPANFGIFWIKREYAEDVFGYHGACNSVVGMLTPEARRDPRLPLEEMARRLDSFGVFTKTALKNQRSNLTLGAEMAGLQTQAMILPMIFLGVAMLVLNVVMLRMAEQQRVIIGTLKALGVSNKSIFFHFLKYGLVVGLCGGILGCGLGALIAEGMTSLYRTIFSFPKLDSDFYPVTMLVAIVIAVFFAGLGTLRGVKRVVTLNPAEAMRPSPPPVGGSIMLERWKLFWRQLDFRWQMVFRGIFRNKGRSIVGVIAAALGGAMVVLALGLADSLNYMVTFQFDKVMLSDFIMNFRDDIDGGAINEAQLLPGITYVEPQLSVACTFINGNHRKKGVITGINCNAKLTRPCNIDGMPARIPQTGLLMTKRLADFLGVKPGDEVTFVPVKGIRRPHKVVVADTVESTFGLPVYANFQFLNDLIGQTSALNCLHMKGRPGKGQLDSIFRQVKRYPKMTSFNVVAEQKAQMVNDFIKKMKSMTIVMVIFAAVIFFGSILNSGLISIAERQREIATFRVLGYRPAEIGAIFLREAMLINMLGAFIGLPLGYWMLYGMCLQFRNDMYCTPCIIQPLSWVYSIILAFSFIVVSYLIIQRAINKLNWSDALKMKE